MNFRRKSTDGFSIGNIILDLAGGLANYAQMATQSIDQRMLVIFSFVSRSFFLHMYQMHLSFFFLSPDTWVNFYGNIGKTLLSLV